MLQKWSKTCWTIFVYSTFRRNRILQGMKFWIYWVFIHVNNTTRTWSHRQKRSITSIQTASFRYDSKWEQCNLWFTWVVTNPKQRHCLLHKWCRSVRRQCTFLHICVYWKSDCHSSGHQDTFATKTVQYSAVQSGHYWLFDRFGSSADICCLALDDSPHSWILRLSGWTVPSVQCVSGSLCRMVVCQYHPDQLWSSLRTREAFGLPCIRNEER